MPSVAATFSGVRWARNGAPRFSATKEPGPRPTSGCSRKVSNPVTSASRRLPGSGTT